MKLWCAGITPEQGLLSPDTFIPIAEETGLIVPLGDYVMREACQQMAQWQQQFPAAGPLSINVNLSGKEAMQGQLVEQVTSILEESGLGGGQFRAGDHGERDHGVSFDGREAEPPQ